MDSIAITKFKGTCSAVLEEVRRTGRPVVVTKWGQPIAQIVPASPPADVKRRLGSLAGTARIVGDIISLLADEGNGSNSGNEALTGHSHLALELP